MYRRGTLFAPDARLPPRGQGKFRFICDVVRIVLIDRRQGQRVCARRLRQKQGRQPKSFGYAGDMPQTDADLRTEWMITSIGVAEKPYPLALTYLRLRFATAACVARAAETWNMLEDG